MTSLLGLCSIFITVAACNACETSSRVRDDVVDREGEAFVFQIPRDKLVEQLRSVLADQGDDLVETDPITFHTTPRFDHGLVIHLLELKSGGRLVHIVDQTLDKTGKVEGSVRGLKLEWELAQRAEPDRALEIMKHANKRADEVPVR